VLYVATLSIGLYLLLEGAYPTTILYPKRLGLNPFLAYTFSSLGRCGMSLLEVSEAAREGVRFMSYTGREESFEYEALRRAEKMASKTSGTKPAGGKKSLTEKFKELIGAR
jgi:hypothetical protein